MLIRLAEAMYFPRIPKKNTAVYSVLVRDELVQPDGTVTRKVFSLIVETEKRLNKNQFMPCAERQRTKSTRFKTIY